MFARILDKDKVLPIAWERHPSGLLVVDLRPGRSFFDLAEDPLYYEAELPSQFECNIFCTLYTAGSCAVLVIPGFANQVIRFHYALSLGILRQNYRFLNEEGVVSVTGECF